MSDPVEDGVQRIRDFLDPEATTDDFLRSLVRNIIAPAVQAERERIRAGVEALHTPGKGAMAGMVIRSDVLAVIDGGSDA